jgi:hypothetical protein
MNRDLLESEVRLLEVGVLESRSLIDEHRCLIAEREEVGRDTAGAKAELAALRHQLRLREADLDRVRTRLEQVE